MLLNWSGPWWYRELGVYSSTGDLVGFGGQCRGPVAADGSAVATGLVSGEKYGFQAYSSAASCQDDRDDTSRWLTAGTLGPVAEVATITTVDLDASDVTGTTATLTIDDAVGYWFAKQTAPSAGPCSSAINGTTHILTSLVEGQAHTYKAYNDAGCTDEHELASATFTTMSLAVSGVTGTGATLTITGHTGNWYYQADTGPDSASCQGPVSTAAEALTGLTAGTSYRYTAYRDSGCAAGSELASEALTTLTLTASGVTDTGATLTISGRSGNWHYKAGTGPHSTCQGPVGTAATDLHGVAHRADRTQELHLHRLQPDGLQRHRPAGHGGRVQHRRPVGGQYHAVQQQHEAGRLDSGLQQDLRLHDIVHHRFHGQLHARQHPGNVRYVIPKCPQS